MVTGHLTSRHVGAPQLLADPLRHDLSGASLTAVQLLPEAECDVLARARLGVAPPSPCLCTEVGLPGPHPGA